MRVSSASETTDVETIGKYQIQKVLGRGGMGTVYEALDPIINRKVALKTMIQGLAESPDLRARFLREAQAAGGLRHRNIVTVYDLGEDKGQPFIAMEFIEGTDLEKIIQNREPHSLEWKIDVHPPDLRRPRLRPPERHRPSRHQARQHPRHARGRGQDHGLRHRPPPVLDDDQERPRARAPCTTWRRSRSRGTRSTTGPTSSRSGPSPTSCSPTASPSTATA